MSNFCVCCNTSFIRYEVVRGNAPCVSGLSLFTSPTPTCLSGPVCLMARRLQILAYCPAIPCSLFAAPCFLASERFSGVPFSRPSALKFLPLPSGPLLQTDAPSGAFQVFQQLPALSLSPSRHTFHLLLQGFASTAQPGMCEHVVQWMGAAGVEPTEQTREIMGGTRTAMDETYQ